jgi:hypothetical protein
MAEVKSDGSGEGDGFRTTKLRSPNYPVIGLRAALNRVGQLYKRYKRNTIPINLAHKEWEYKEGSGLGNQVVGALKSFGLIEVDGKENERRLRLSDLAYRLMNHGSPGSRDWHELLKRAALEPPLYAELWAKWKGDEFPDDGLIRHYLLHDREEGVFNPDKVDGFIENFRDSLRFAQLLPDGTIDDPVANNSTDGEKGRTPSIGAGDLVQWTNAGTDMFAEPRAVLGFSEDGQWAFAEGSRTGVPVVELTVMESAKPNTKPTVPPAQPPASPFPPPSEKPSATEGAVIKFDLPRGNSIEIRLKAKVTSQEFQKIKKIFELSEVAFVQDDDDVRWDRNRIVRDKEDSPPSS